MKGLRIKGGCPKGQHVIDGLVTVNNDTLLSWVPQACTQEIAQKMVDMDEGFYVTGECQVCSFQLIMSNVSS